MNHFTTMNESNEIFNNRKIHISTNIISLFCWRWKRRRMLLPDSLHSLCCGCCCNFCVWAQKRSLHAQNKTCIAYLILTWKGRYSLKIYVCDCAPQIRKIDRERIEYDRQQSIRDNVKFSKRVLLFAFFAGLNATV